jgi:hypothetical protein
MLAVRGPKSNAPLARLDPAGDAAGGDHWIHNAKWFGEPPVGEVPRAPVLNHPLSDRAGQDDIPAPREVCRPVVIPERRLMVSGVDCPEGLPPGWSTDDAG